MEQANSISKTGAPSKLRIALTWLMLIGMILFWVVFWIWRNHGREPEPASVQEGSRQVVMSILSLFIGGFFLVCGVVVYLVMTFTGGLCFSYTRPVWPGAKVRKYFVNIIATVLLGLGLGFILSAFVSPMLSLAGLDPGVATMVPVMVMVGGIQLLQLWVLIWSPTERRMIVNRLAALGVQRTQLQNAFLVGLSDPASGLAKRFASIEEDMGAMWVGPEQLIYWGDGEQFSIQREQIAQVERKADNRSTTVLAGIQHVILHVRLPDGTVRQMRLHVEGQWTLGGKRRKMDELARAINQWMNG